jgi:hypothetical protein
MAQASQFRFCPCHRKSPACRAAPHREGKLKRGISKSVLLRGTEGSNPSPSRRESENFRFLARPIPGARKIEGITSHSQGARNEGRRNRSSALGKGFSLRWD